MNNGFKPGDMIEAEVFKITNFGAFVKLPSRPKKNADPPILKINLRNSSRNPKNARPI